MAEGRLALGPLVSWLFAQATSPKPAQAVGSRSTGFAGRLLTGIIFMDKKVKQDTNDGTFSVWVISAVRLSIHSGGFVLRSQFRFPPPRVEVLETVWGDRGRGELPSSRPAQVQNVAAQLITRSGSAIIEFQITTTSCWSMLAQGVVDGV
ncbi:hypothetical protein BDBG_09311, partial [Blastomyces gilchristii SLH14081]